MNYYKKYLKYNQKGSAAPTLTIDQRLALYPGVGPDAMLSIFFFDAVMGGQIQWSINVDNRIMFNIPRIYDTRALDEDRKTLIIAVGRNIRDSLMFALIDPLPPTVDILTLNNERLSNYAIKDNDNESMTLRMLLHLLGIPPTVRADSFYIRDY